MVTAAGTAATTTVRFRTAPKIDESSVALADADPDVLANAHPWREFRWRAGQKHYSGTYWSATEGRHVIYESRLELSRLLFADFDRSVRRICAQPFHLKRESAGEVSTHIPDYFLMTDRGPKVVDVKPKRRLTKPKVAATFAWTRTAIESRGWIYEVCTEPDPLQLANIRFLAGYRRAVLFDPELLEVLRGSPIDGLSIGEVLDEVSGWPRPLIKGALFHLLWSQEIHVDLSQPLAPGSALSREI